ncbi:phosphatidylglycerol:prolipoprotein diacylglycerol transferase [Geomicrobium halophilum]|uniref:Phosphatidylglycerol--prolipoprotein diacylglyceryl transferase n=1 Tax=Geomicrobium halophilum TaxID=549000 RepID=A0A841PK01_9BACL|nr:prolipoprotein diacylglyceryl transferase [Geomicrobium halophilum]MBB6449110.1 phosphatidylglycerol:prolipoprotein diacylglycerol transferase [Geomicrobium halophilum]
MEMINPVAFEIGPIQLYWYGIIIVGSAFLGLWLAVRESERRGLPKDTFVDLVFIGFPVSVLFARLYYVLFSWEYYSANPEKIIAIWEGGLAMHGVLIGAVLTVIVFSRVRNISFWQLVDIMAPSLILAQAIGRWGNFINQEAHGGPVTREFLESLYLPDFIISQMNINGTFYHPTFLYESIWNFGGFIVLMLLRRVNLRRGELFLTYIIYYSIGRFFIEGLRTDSLMLTDHLRMAQVVSLLLIFIALLMIGYRRKKGHANARYLDEGA